MNETSSNARGARKDTKDKKNKKLKTAVDKAVTRARRVGKSVATKVSDTSEMIHLKRTDRAIRAEMDDHEKAIGRRVFSLHRRAEMRGTESPFARFKAIMDELEKLRDLEHERQTNREQMGKLREEMHHRR